MEQLSSPSAHSSMSKQVSPSPKKPLSQEQEKLPGVLVQVAIGEQLAVPSAHSLLSTHVLHNVLHLLRNASPKASSRSAQKDLNSGRQSWGSGVPLQVASSAQLSVPSAHSSSSTHVTPLPEKPASQEQLKPPEVLVQVALESQLLAPLAHSSISEQVVPVPE